MDQRKPSGTPAEDHTEIAQAIDAYRQTHPEVEEAMSIFELSNDAYESALEAMYGPHVTWASSANPQAQ